MKGLPVRRAAVLGAGVMGRGIAAHLAGVGIEVLLLDIVPPNLTGGTPKERNAFAQGGLDSALRNKPALFFEPGDASYVQVGNLEDDLASLAQVDWIVEVVKEDLQVKRALFEKLDAVRRPGTLISSNTSGLPLALLTQGRSEDFRKHFLITHFFNPVRYLKLLEVVSGPETAPDLVERFALFAQQRLGKGVVFAKDSPAFIANRIGTFTLMDTIHRMLERGQSPEFVDAIFGRPMGRAKSAVFRTADVVGLDTLGLVVGDLRRALKADPQRERFAVPEYLAKLIERGWLGSKTGQGCYKKDGKAILTCDPYTLEYRPALEIESSALAQVKRLDDPGQRIRTLVNTNDEVGQFAWDCLAPMLIYAAANLVDIADDLVQVDNAMKWGFGHELGPFETWDTLGVPETVARMKADGLTVPAWVDDLLASGRTRFYDGPKGDRRFYKAGAGVIPERTSPRSIHLPETLESPQLVAANAGARLWDIGDGVGAVEFATKMNAVDDSVIEMLERALVEAETRFDALVIGNHGTEAFSAGANLKLILGAAREGRFDRIGAVVDGFQQATNRLRQASIPVVAAPFGLTLGGGAEICLAADAIQAHTELYMGLVEVGVGLIPAGGGCFSLLYNRQSVGPEIDPLVYLRDVFTTIGLGKVSTSAAEARKLGFLKANDRVTMDRDELLGAAKAHALGLAKSDYRPVSRRALPVAGTMGYATISQSLWGMEQNHQASAHDVHIGRALARILTGGDVAAGALVTETRFQELEREAFLSLCGEPKTQARIEYMLKNNKPLRN